MSDPNLRTQQQIQALQDSMERLRKSDAGGAVGTAFPTGISSGFRFFRTDLGFLCYYDGTRWLTDFDTAHPLKINDATAPVTYAAAGSTITVQSAYRGDYGIYVTRVSAITTVATTNDGTNNWTVTLRASLAGASVVTIHAFSTSADVAGTAATHDAAPSTLAAVTNKNLFDVVVTKNNAPGAITINGLTVYYRLIVT